MFGVWQRATGLGILGVALLPSGRVTLDKSPGMTGLSPWSGRGEGGGVCTLHGSHSHLALGWHPGCAREWKSDPAVGGRWDGLQMPCLALGEAVSDLGEEGRSGPPTENCDH